MPDVRRGDNLDAACLDRVADALHIGTEEAKRIPRLGALAQSQRGWQFGTPISSDSELRFRDIHRLWNSQIMGVHEMDRLRSIRSPSREDCDRSLLSLVNCVHFLSFSDRVCESVVGSQRLGVRSCTSPAWAKRNLTCCISFVRRERIKMKKHLAITAIVIIAFGFSNAASAAWWPWSDDGAQTSSTAARKVNDPMMMSFGFVQETASVLSRGRIRADIYNTTDYPSQVRIGAFGGEVLIDPSDGPTATGLGYKRSINSKMAVYGKLFLATGGGQTDNWTLGVSHTAQRGRLVYNGNAHYTNANAANESTLLLNGAAFYRVIVKSVPGPVQLGGEVSVRMSPGPTRTDLFMGVRWQPKRNVLIDVGVATSIDGDTFIGTPAFVRLNLGF